MSELVVRLSDEDLERISVRVVELLAERADGNAPGAPTDSGDDSAAAERMLTADEAADVLRVSRRYVLRLAREGALESIKERKRVLFPETGLRRYLEGGRRPAVQVGATAAGRLTAEAARVPRVRAKRRERF
jgi:excisionase family DNA binding protein